jgi:hypothetical protein
MEDEQVDRADTKALQRVSGKSAQRPTGKPQRPTDRGVAEGVRTPRPAGGGVPERTPNPPFSASPMCRSGRSNSRERGACHRPPSASAMRARIGDLLVADIVSGVAQNARRRSPDEVPSNAGSRPPCRPPGGAAETGVPVQG